MTLTNKGHNLVFCHQCPFGGLRAGSTRACVVGNDGVRALSNNAASGTMKPHLARDGRGIVRGSDDRQYQAGRELGLCSMVNTCEWLINVVTPNKRKVLRMETASYNAWTKMVSGQEWVFLTHSSQMLHHRRIGQT